MQRATPWFVGPAIHGARAAQLFLRSRAHSRERARCAHTGAQQIDAQRSRLIAHSLSRLECRLPLMANTSPPDHAKAPFFLKAKRPSGKDRSFAGSHSTKQTWARVPKQSNLKSVYKQTTSLDHPRRNRDF